MNTPMDLTLSKSPNKAETFHNHKRIIFRLIAGLALVLALTALVLLNRSNGQTQAEEITAVSYTNALEMQYAQPWLDGQNKPVILYGNALEMQYAQPWLDAQKSLDCHSRLDVFYACQNGLKPSGQ